jgi:hypothetical protein
LGLALCVRCDPHENVLPALAAGVGVEDDSYFPVGARLCAEFGCHIEPASAVAILNPAAGPPDARKPILRHF